MGESSPRRPLITLEVAPHRRDGRKSLERRKHPYPRRRPPPPKKEDPLRKNQLLTPRKLRPQPEERRHPGARRGLPQNLGRQGIVSHPLRDIQAIEGDRKSKE